jgi:hypothetical protein
LNSGEANAQAEIGFRLWALGFGWFKRRGFGHRASGFRGKGNIHYQISLFFNMLLVAEAIRMMVKAISQKK